MVDQRPRRLRGDRDLNIRHCDSEIQQNDEDAVNERIALASRAFVYTKCKNGQSEASPDCPFFLLVEHPPIPLEHWKTPMAARFCETLLMSRPIFIMFFFLSCFIFFDTEDTIHIGFDHKQLTNFLSGLPKICVCLFFLCDQLGILAIKRLDGR